MREPALGEGGQVQDDAERGGQVVRNPGTEPRQRLDAARGRPHDHEARRRLGHPRVVSPGGGSKLGRDRDTLDDGVEPPQQDVVRALFSRVRRAVGEAEQAVARSHTLASMRHVLGERRLLRRCAWCGRFTLGEGWVAEAELPGFVPKRAVEMATHTICPECEAQLVREGKSHALGEADRPD